MVLLGDFIATVGRSVEVDDVIGMFGEDACNASGNSSLNGVEVVSVEKIPRQRRRWGPRWR